MRHWRPTSVDGCRYVDVATVRRGGHRVISGGDLRAARLSSGFTLGQFARMIGRDKGHLSRVETGKGREITPALVRDYERALGVTIAATAQPGTAASSGDSVEDVRRRELLGGIG